MSSLRRTARLGTATVALTLLAGVPAASAANGPPTLSEPSTTAAAPTASEASSEVIARTGSVGAIVSAVDLALRADEKKALGRALRSGAAAVSYGPETTARVRAFQKRHRLPTTGVVGDLTYAALRPGPRLKAGTQTIGRSVRGRAITLQVVGSPTAKKKVLVVGCIHGNECAGVPILDRLARTTPPAGTAYLLLRRPNPDGAIAGTRQNARKVDLNRNFVGWKPNGKPGYVYYPGPGALSEPETLVLFDLVRATRPSAFVTYHQQMRVIDYAGRGGRYAITYGRQVGLPVKVLPAYPGSNATWLGTRYPDTVVLTVELPRPVSSASLSRHATAVRYLAAHH